MVGNYGKHMELDVLSGIDMLIEKGWVDPQRLAIMGHSHGGDEVYYAITHSDRYKAAVINDSGIAMPELFVPANEVTNSFLTTWYGKDIMTRLIGKDPVKYPWADPFEIRSALLLRWAGLQPVRAGWGVHPGRTLETSRLFYALDSNKVPFDVLVDQDQHQVTDERWMLEWQSRLLQWFDYFVRDRGDNPIPAMASPFDYSDKLQQAAVAE